MKTSKIFVILTAMMLIITDRTVAQCNLSVSFTNTINAHSADITPVITGSSGHTSITWNIDYLDSIVTTLPVRVLNSGIYTFLIQDTVCGYVWPSDTVIIPACQLNAAIIISPGTANDTFEAVISGGAAPYSYFWNSVGSGLTDPVNIVDTSGSWGRPGACVLITDDNGCQTYTCDTIVGAGCLIEGNISSYNVGSYTTLVANPTNPNAVYQIIWHNGYKSDSIMVTQPGIYCVEIEDNTLCRFTVCDTVPGWAAGIYNIANSHAITIYPNPSAGTFYFIGANNGDAIEVFDLLGQKVYTGTTDQDNYTVNLSNKGKGVFIYKIYDSGNNIQTGKIIIE